MGGPDRQLLGPAPVIRHLVIGHLDGSLGTLTKGSSHAGSHERFPTRSHAKQAIREPGEPDGALSHGNRYNNSLTYIKMQYYRINQINC